MLPPVVDFVGYYGPVILFTLTFYFLIERAPYLIVFTFGSIASIFLNHILKSTFREPRPQGQIQFIDHDHLTGVQQYGLPSGHAQAAFFALAFLFFSGGPQSALYLMFFICIMTLFQRWKFRRHTVKQLIIGSLIGTAFAYILVYVTQYYLYGSKKNLAFFI